MDLETYFKTFFDTLFGKYSKFLSGKKQTIPNSKESYLQKLILKRNDIVTVVRIDSPVKLQIGSQQFIELSKGQTCLIFKESWRKKMAIRLRDFDELEDLMYQLQSKHILNIEKHFFIKGDDYEVFFLDGGLEKTRPELLAKKMFESQLKSAELSEKEYREKKEMNIEGIGFKESSIVEFKEQFPEKAIDVAKELVAFANTRGGKIYFGVDDDGFIIGIENPVDLQQRICGVARNSCEPELNPSFEIQKHNHKEILIVQVDESKHVHRRSDGKFYTRIGPNSFEMSVDELEELIVERRKARLK